MPVIAKLRYLRIAPRKVRLVADLIRGKKNEEAQILLNFTTKNASRPLLKLLRQAEVNAKNNFQLDPANLYISKITVDEGPKLKRWMPRARGQAYEIQKKTSHITIVLDEIVKKAKKKKIRQLAEKKAKAEMVEKPSFAPASAKAMADKKVSEDKEEKIIKPEKPKFQPEIEKPKPKIEKGIKRIFRRKAF